MFQYYLSERVLDTAVTFITHSENDSGGRQRISGSSKLFNPWFHLTKCQGVHEQDI